MIVEYVRYHIPGEGSEFEEGYAQAQAALQVSPHCLGWELSRCAEDRSQYILRIEWDSADGHLQGFRGSHEFQAFLAAVRPFFHNILEMRHYELTGIKGEKLSPP